jgi:uncharacterized protein (DUF1501 family)
MLCSDKETMMKRHGFDPARRMFLGRSAAAAAALSPLAALLGGMRLDAAETGGYKAIVCVLLEGGADVFNMIAPTPDDAYDAYRRARPSIALPRDSLLELTHANANGLNPLSYGMRSNMRRMHGLFGEKRLAVVANVGTLIRPVTPQEVADGAPVPFELFAHNTQRAQWMMGSAAGDLRSGWAGRASRLVAREDPYFNIDVSDAGSVLQSGGEKDAARFDSADISPDTMSSYGFGPESGGGDLGRVYQALYEARTDDAHPLMASFASRRVEELHRPDELEGLFDGVRSFDGFSNGVHEVGRPLGRQLELAARILSVRENFPSRPSRQIFFVNHHGWDTHDSDNEHQVGYLSDSLGAFWDALTAMGIENDVTVMTISDFGRSLGSNGNGTDHGWGSHAFVMGGAVRGGDIYGKMPALEPDSPDAWEGRMVPTLAMEQYYATVLKWFGLSEAELKALFPHLESFDTADLGFMG